MSDEKKKGTDCVKCKMEIEKRNFNTIYDNIFTLKGGINVVENEKCDCCGWKKERVYIVDDTNKVFCEECLKEGIKESEKSESKPKRSSE